MSITRVLALSFRTRSRRWLVAVVAALGLLALTPGDADALSVTVTMPTPVTVGQSGLTAHVTLTNTMQGPLALCGAGTCSPASEGIILIPSCASAATPAPTCSAPDPGVFAFAANAPVAPGSCGLLITSFNVVTADAVQGKLRLEPVGGPLILSAAGSPQAHLRHPADVQRHEAARRRRAGRGRRPDLRVGVRRRGWLPTGGKDSATARAVTTVSPVTTQPPPPPIVVPPPPPPIAVPPPPRRRSSSPPISITSSATRRCSQTSASGRSGPATSSASGVPASYARGSCATR